eukprot:4266081-Pyramimonas_sp.AAC.1
MPGRLASIRPLHEHAVAHAGANGGEAVDPNIWTRLRRTSSEPYVSARPSQMRVERRWRRRRRMRM